MAPYPDVVGVIRWDMTWGDGISEFGSRVFLGGQLPGADVGGLTDLCNALNTLMVDNIVPLITQAVSFIGSTCTDLSSATGARATANVNVEGGSLGDPCSVNVCMDANASIPIRYRGGHPLTHFPPSSAHDLGGARQWSATTLGVWNTALADLLTGVNGTNFESGPDCIWTVLRGYRAGAAPEAVHPYPVTSLHARQYVGTMRRRARSLH